MRATFNSLVFVAAIGIPVCLAEAQRRTIEQPASALEPENVPLAKLAILSDDDLNEVLSRRLSGDMGDALRNFGKMFLVNSRLQIGVGIGLVAENKKIANTELQATFPESYHPTLRELLDSIALQSSSAWNYDKTGKHFSTDQRSDTPVEGLAIFELKPTKREKPYKVALAKGWRAVDKGHWTMYIPRQFPVGMDIYEFGTYSPSKKDDEQKFSDKIRTDVSLDWARRVEPKANEKDFEEAKVGQFDALHYEVLLKGQAGQEIRWRQWVFMDGNKCYFIVSTIIPNLEDQIYPDVKQMLETFEIKKPEPAKD